MARTNKTGISFLGLGLTKGEDKVLKALIAEEDTDGKKLLRTLVRDWMKSKIK